MVRSLTLLTIGPVLLLSVASSRADDAVLAQLYGNGVHAYFSQDYAKSHEYLTTAIDGGTKDPRTYYFRAMAYLKLGRAEEAEMDFAKGAELETKDYNRHYDVARSLERIQGRTRLMLEEHRIKARLAARQRAEKLMRVRYNEIRRETTPLPPQPIQQAPGVPADVPSLPAAEPPQGGPFDVGPTAEPAAGH